MSITNDFTWHVRTETKSNILSMLGKKFLPEGKLAGYAQDARSGLTDIYRNHTKSEHGADVLSADEEAKSIHDGVRTALKILDRSINKLGDVARDQARKEILEQCDTLRAQTQHDLWKDVKFTYAAMHPEIADRKVIRAWQEAEREAAPLAVEESPHEWAARIRKDLGDALKNIGRR
jgi:hypothetical protein